MYECYGCDSVSVHICVPDHNNLSYSLAGFPPSLFSFYPAECINLMQKNQADCNKQINIRHLQKNKTDSTTRIRKSVHCRLGWPAFGVCAPHFMLSVSKPLGLSFPDDPPPHCFLKAEMACWGRRPEVTIRALPAPQKHSRQLQPDKQWKWLMTWHKFTPVMQIIS